MSDKLTISASDEQESRARVGFWIGKRQRILAGGVGLVLLFFGVTLAAFGGAVSVALLSLVLGAMFLLIAFMGHFGRISVSTGGGQTIHIEPSGGGEPIDSRTSAELPTPDEPSGAVASAETSAEPGTPLVEAFEAWRRGDYRAFDSKSKEAASGEKSEAMAVGIEAMRLAYLYGVGQTENLDKLQDLRKRHPRLPHPVTWTGYCYEVAGELEKAAEVYRLALASGTWEDEGRVTITTNLAEALGKLHRFADGVSVLNEGLAAVSSDVSRSEMHKGLAKLYYESGDKELGYLHAERALELSPGDVEARFNLAYDYSEAGRELLALHHYLIAESQRRGSAELNNIGVVLEEIGLPITAARYYRRAIVADNSLAAANLAKIAGRNGLMAQAKEILEEAQKMSTVNKAVHQTLGLLETWKEDEAKVLARVKEAAAAERTLTIKVTEARHELGNLGPVDDIEGVWQTSIGDIRIVRDGAGWVARFRTDKIWDWELRGSLKDNLFSFSWSNDRKSQNTEGTGFFFFFGDQEFEGVIRDTPRRGEASFVQSSRRQPLASERSVDSIRRLFSESPPAGDEPNN